jgi:DNA repair protein RadC
MMKKNEHLAINQWSISDRPREKLIQYGSQHLSEAELLAILVGSGSREESAVDMCRRILASTNQDLDVLARYQIEDFTRFKGMGPAKAVSIIAALELGRRRQSSAPQLRPKITSSYEAFQVIGQSLSDLLHEEFWVLMLDNAGKLIKKVQISKGGVTATYVDQKLIWKQALEKLATSIILVHNHPSGTLKPSQQDIELTRKIAYGGKQLGILVNDHLIIGGGSYYSFADEGEACLR